MGYYDMVKDVYGQGSEEKKDLLKRTGNFRYLSSKHMTVRESTTPELDHFTIGPGPGYMDPESYVVWFGIRGAITLETGSTSSPLVSNECYVSLAKEEALKLLDQIKEQLGIV